jgi:hypothetical protein
MELLDHRIGDRRQPALDPLRGIVGHAFDVNGMRACARQLAGVVVRHIEPVRIRREHLARRLPQLLEAGVLSERSLRNLVFGEVEQAVLAVDFGHERLEGLRQPLRRPAIGDDRRGDEGGDRLVLDAVDERGRELRLRGLG